MDLRNLRNVLIALVIAGAATGCSKKEETLPDEQPIPTAINADENANGDSDTGRAAGMQSINFPYDSFVIDDQNKDILRQNAQILKDKPSIQIQIEGHCDERGGIQYNIALGEKRANATKKALVGMGVSGDRVSTISFGKERPLDPGKSDEAYAKNRRSNFVITSK